MKKELIIMVYKINVGGLSSQKVEEYMYSLIETYSLRDDEELKNDYTIREIFLPIRENDGETDVKIIFPVPRYTTSPEINDLVAEISNKIKEDPTNNFKLQWERLVRELKLRKIDSINE